MKNLCTWILRTFGHRDQTLYNANIVEIAGNSSLRLLFPALVSTQTLPSSAAGGSSKIFLKEDFSKKPNLLGKTKSFQSLQSREEKRKIPHHIHLVYTWGLSLKLQLWRWKGRHLGIHQQKVRKCYPKPVNTAKKNLWKGTLSEEGPKLFNCLPRSLRNLSKCTKEVFKNKLDHLLRSLPDEPLLSCYLPFRRADSNSI